MNNRLEYYRQLQQISDTVAPYDEESVGKPMNDTLFAEKLRQEEAIDEKISSLKAKRRYLLHIKEEPDSDGSSRICIICQTDFEHGVLTVCGHKYCKECLQLWWKQHRTCPICKKRLKARDFHQITYRPEDFVVREEKTTTKMGPAPERSSKNSSIYTDISTGTLKEIKNIDVNGYFGTKIDTLARHILWLRMHDPGSKSIVFSQYRGFLDVLSVALSHYKIGYSNVDSKGGIEKFKNEPAIECFLLHAKAHSSGLNLVNATHVFLCEPLINTAIELQAIARVHRIGQHRATTVWMYLVSGTVEEAIYDLSVSRRLSHITAKKKEEETLASSMAHLNGNDKEGIDETTIDSANSMELQNTALSKIIAAGASGGEIVKKDDLWQCLFGNLSKNKESGHHSMGADSEVGKFLRAEAAKQRAAKK
jgi:E3 ubiquitin-protein ligase SHPRH